MSLDLMSTTSRVETPFIVVELGGCTLGGFNSNSKKISGIEGTYKRIVSQYPNFMQSLSVVKINGALNNYTINLKYQISEYDDPNLLEKIFSRAKADRTIKISYGDLSVPSYIYKQEEAIITTIKSNLDVAGSNISYTINATSKALSLNAGVFDFPRRVAKPSDVIKELLYSNDYNMLDIFYGMQDKATVLSKNLIASDDKPVTIEAQSSVTTMKYLNYLVSCMTSSTDIGTKLLKSSRYTLTVYDDVKNELGGPYFKVTKVKTNINSVLYDIYEINVGYPDKNVISFNVNEDETYSIYYDYSQSVKQSEYVYRIDDKGNLINEYSPTLSNSSSLMKTTEADRTWWTQMTQFPITATLTLKGLLKPAMLMTYIKVNVLFYGKPHIATGLYIITKQTDQIDASGYKTTLNLTRIGTAED